MILKNCIINRRQFEFYSCILYCIQFDCDFHLCMHCSQIVIKAVLNRNPFRLRPKLSGVLAVLSAKGLRYQKIEVIQFENSIERAEVAHYESPQLYLFCLSFRL